MLLRGGRFFSPKIRRLRRIYDASSRRNGGVFDILAFFPRPDRVSPSASAMPVKTRTHMAWHIIQSPIRSY